MTCSRCMAFAAAIAAGGAAAPAAGQEPWERPAYKLLRWQENWLPMRDKPADAPSDFFDPIKYVPLSDDGDIWASFGGSSRLRFEGWSNFNFQPNSDAFVLWRALLHGDVHFGKNVRVYFEGISAQASNRTLPGGKRTLDVDSIDLEQAFVDLRLDLDSTAAVTLRTGQQTFLFGKQRLVSPLHWSNTLRRWAGADVIFRVGDWSVDAFWAQFVPVQKYQFNEADEGDQLYGAYATGPLAGRQLSMDAYFLGRSRSAPVAYNGTTGGEDAYTVGGRLFGALAGTGFDYNVEGAYQFGRVDGGDRSAFMIGSEAGYTLGDVWGKPRPFVGFDAGSGDENPGGDVETFDQLFPLGHAYLGYIDVVGRQNVISFNVGVNLDPMEKLKLRLAGYFFWRYSDADALYDAGSNVVRAGNLSGASEIGQEIDLTATWRIDRHTQLEVGYSHFFPGEFIRTSGTGPPIDFVYAQVEFTF